MMVLMNRQRETTDLEYPNTEENYTQSDDDRVYGGYNPEMHAFAN